MRFAYGFVKSVIFLVENGDTRQFSSLSVMLAKFWKTPAMLLRETTKGKYFNYSQIKIQTIPSNL